MSAGWLKRCWDAFVEWGLDVPDCPACHGTGEETDHLGDYVYWKGEIHLVCDHCKGKGKV